MAEASSSAAAPKRKVQRSPNYPSISLETAIQRARTLHAAEGRHETPADVALRHWGYTNPMSSNAQSTLSALVKFGLLQSNGQGSARRVKLTDSALKIILDERQDSPERHALIRTAALMPGIYSELWAKWGASLPSDPNIRSYLLIDKHFNSSVLDDFLKDYKATIAFAHLDKTEDQPKNGGEETEIEIGSYVQWASGGVDQFIPPRKVVGFSEDDEWAFVEGSQTGVPVSELSVVEPPAPSGEGAPRRTPPPNPHALTQPPTPKELPHSGPVVTFDLPRGNKVEIRLRSKVTTAEFNKLKQIFALSEVAFVEDDDGGGLDKLEL